MVAGIVDPVPPHASAAAHDMRRAARRTRELASVISLNRDRATLISYAEELEREAEALERQAAPRPIRKAMDRG
jgi:hypothetical protein